MKVSYLNLISQQKYIFHFFVLLVKQKDVSSESTSVRKSKRVGIEPIHFCLWMKHAKTK